MSDRVELAAASLMVTVDKLLKPWVKLSTVAAGVVEAMLKEFTGAEELDEEDIGKAAVQGAISKMHKEHRDRQKELASVVLKLLQAGNAERAAKICAGVLEDRE